MEDSNKRILARVKKEGYYGCIDSNGNTIIPFKYEYISEFSEGLAYFQKRSNYSTRYGYIDSKGNTVIDPVYRYASLFHEGMSIAGKDGDFIGFINKYGEFVIPQEYCSATSFSGGIATIVKYKRTRKNYIETIERKYVDINGHEVFDTKKTEAVHSFHDGMAIIQNYAGIKMFGNTKSGFINNNYVEVISTKYSSARSFVNGYATVYKDKKAAVIDKNGNLVIDNKFDDIPFGFHDGLAYFRTNGYGLLRNEGFINIRGEIVIDIRNIAKLRYFDSGGAFCDGMLWISKKNKYGFMNTTGNITVPMIYDSVYSFSERLAAIEENNRWSFIDKTGTKITNNYYDKVYQFCEGFSAVSKNRKWGFINKEGIETIPCEFDEVYSFEDTSLNKEVKHDGHSGAHHGAY